MESKTLQERIDAHNEVLEQKLRNYKYLAALLGISENKAKELMRRKDAPVVRIGRNKYVVASKIDQWLDNMITNNELY